MGVNSIQSNITTVIEQIPASSVGPAVPNDTVRVAGQVKKAKASDVNTLTPDPIGTKSRDYEKAEVEQAVSQLNRIVQSLDRKLSFFVDDASGRFGVKVIDRETNEIIRQIPPEHVLSLSAKIHEMIGALLDEKS